MGNSSRPVIELNPLTPITVSTAGRSDVSLFGVSAGAEVVVGPNSNGFGIRTVSAAAPVNTQGSDGDIWYQV
jgi:hypothetical protein